uniref:Uncharacterized protein n=1 Tax=Solanum lycopersicum TaxID=4081 RepID=A0A3Q7G1G7_SOLLC
MKYYTVEESRKVQSAQLFNFILSSLLYLYLLVKLILIFILSRRKFSSIFYL